MNPALQSILHKVAAAGTAIMMVATLSVIAVNRAENRAGEQVATNASESGDGSGVAGGMQPAGDQGAQAPQPGDPSAQPVPGTPTTATPVPGGAPAAGAQPQPGAPTPGAAAPGTPQPTPAGQCKDYNPNEGVYCDKYVIGGTTVLSGPLASYGEAGLKGGQAWLNYYNKEIAPKEGLRKAQLVYYDDSLDPNKTLQFVKRMNEVDHVLYLAGITSPEAVISYLEATGFPMIGDYGLSPKSYKTPMIFPTAIAQVNAYPLRLKIAKQDNPNIKSFAVVQDVLPGQDASPLKQAWSQAADTFGVKMVAYETMDSTSSSCDAQFQSVAAAQPNYIYLPTAASAFLACMRAARVAQVKPGSPTSSWLMQWAGGSNLQIELDQCGPTCEGIASYPTPFRDPRTYDTPQMAAYRQNMATYAPGIEITGFIPINYYHDGWVIYNLMKQAGITNNLSRKTLIEAANKFGPFDTGFGNSITWRPELPRIPSVCAYRVLGKGGKWVFDSNQICLAPNEMTKQ